MFTIKFEAPQTSSGTCNKVLNFSLVGTSSISGIKFKYPQNFFENLMFTLDPKNSDKLSASPNENPKIEF